MGEPSLPRAALPAGWEDAAPAASDALPAASDTVPAASGAPTPRLRWSAFGGTHQGRVRPINEDRFLVRGTDGLFAVADGMGGHSHGDIAASAVVTELDRVALPDGFEARAGAVCGAVDRANGAIRDVAGAGAMTIGSTLVALMLHADRYVALWCGDSRAYRVRDGAIEPLTRDHSEAAALLESGAISGAEAAHWPGRSIVHAVGVSHRPHIDRSEGVARAGDAFVLCSDGLTEHVGEADIARLAWGTAPEDACRALIRAALAAGGTDNVSVVVVACEAA